MAVLIDRLVHRRLFHLAFQICKYLKISQEKGASRILSHWACYKVSCSACEQQDRAFKSCKITLRVANNDQLANARRLVNKTVVRRKFYLIHIAVRLGSTEGHTR